MPGRPGLPPRCGLGLKPEHFRSILETRPELGFFEVHAENYMVEGGPLHHYLAQIRSHYPLSLHGVGLSIGGECGLDVAPMPAAAAAELARLLPFASVGNPVDSTGQVYNDMSLVTKFADGLLGSGAYDSLIAFYSTLGLSDRLAEALLAAFRPVREAYPDHVILLSILAGEAWRRRFEAAGFLLFDDPNRAVRAVAALAWFAASLVAPRRLDPPPAPRLRGR